MLFLLPFAVVVVLGDVAGKPADTHMVNLWCCQPIAFPEGMTLCIFAHSFKTVDQYGVSYDLSVLTCLYIYKLTTLTLLGWKSGALAKNKLVRVQTFD